MRGSRIGFGGEGGKAGLTLAGKFRLQENEHEQFLVQGVRQGQLPCLKSGAAQVPGSTGGVFRIRVRE